MKNLEAIDVVILCGGLGKRLRSTVGRTQKTMAAIQGRPFLDFLLQYLCRQGFRRVILCTGFRSEQIEEYYRKNPWGLKIVFSQEKAPLGTGGAIRNAGRLVKSNPFMALNGDCFCRLNYRTFLQFYVSRKAQGVLTLSRAKNRRDFGTVILDSTAQIIGFAEKKAGEIKRSAGKIYISNGIYCFDREILKLMPRKKKFSIEYDFFPQLPALLQKKFLGFVSREPFIDIGTPQRYRKAQRFLTLSP
jgi:NDP-sugar pyrophosphorylase family protein